MNSGITIKGFDEFEHKLDKMAKAAKELNGTHPVPFTKLFNEHFMRKYTNFLSFDKLLEAGGWNVNCQEDFNAIPDNEFDIYINKTTQFNNWKDMMAKASEEYVAEKLGFH